MTKADDSSLTPDQLSAVRRCAVDLLNKGNGWEHRPSRIADLMEAAKLQVEPISAFDHGVIESYARKFGGIAKNFLKSAIDKVMGILDVFGNIVHIDPSVNKEKQNFLKLHEAGHSEMPHQRGLFRWIQDCQQMLEPEISDLFEREANNFATIVLFQDDRYALMAADSAFGISVPLKLGRKFGASAYAAMREYVRKSTKACAVVVLNAPVPCERFGMTASVRRTEVSEDFTRRFGPLKIPETITTESVLSRFIPAAGKRMSRPGVLPLEDRNGTVNEFIAEGFCTPRNVFILMHARATLTKTTIILPSGFSPPA